MLRQRPHAVDLAARGLETLVRILRGDARGAAVLAAAFTALG